MALTMTARLLCAARHAYMVAANGPVPPAPYLGDIGYANPAGFASGDDRIDAGLVGEAPDAIIVAFRGTLPPQSPDRAQVILDWANDCNALLTADPLGLPGKVHAGFLGAVDALWPAMQPAVAALIAASPGKPIYITGHSKGGPMANIAAARLYKLQPHAAIYVCTFAGARAGDTDFATAYEAVTNSDRYEFADDIVPHLPPMDALRVLAKHLPMKDSLPQIAASIDAFPAGYVSVGNLHFIEWDGTIVPESVILEVERIASLMKVLGELQFATIVADHSIDPPNPPDPPNPCYYSVLYR
jgi:Lipase (class 3)